MGGSLAVESVAGQGSTFTATLPVELAKALKLAFTLGAADYLTKPIDWKRLTSVLERYRDQAGPGRVLVVEDDASVRELLQRNLEKDQWTVALAENGRLALERIAEARPSFILPDLMMPERTEESPVEDYHV